MTGIERVKEKEEMISEWKVSNQYIGGERMYIAMRILDISQPQHGGNVETRGEYSTDRDAVQALVDMLNVSEKTQTRRMLYEENQKNDAF